MDTVVNATIALIGLGFAITLIVLHKEGRLLTISALLGGLALVPITTTPVLAAVAAADSAVAIAVPTVAAAAATLWVFVELKDSGTARLTPYIALVIPVLWLAGGGVFLTLYENFADLVNGLDAFATQAGTR